MIGLRKISRVTQGVCVKTFNFSTPGVAGGQSLLASFVYFGVVDNGASADFLLVTNVLVLRVKARNNNSLFLH